MVYEKNNQKRIVAIVCAYNEEARIGNVLEVLTSYKDFDGIVVIDDGSSDHTAKIAASFPVRLIQNQTNIGKGRSMDIAVRATDADIIFFCDADVRGLSHPVISETLSPVVSGTTEMMIAMRNRTIYFLRFVLTIIPLLGGERALTRELWKRVPGKYKEGFMIETALNFYARYYASGFQYKVFPGLTQTIKEKKYGFWKGLAARARMFWEIAQAEITLQLKEVPHEVRSGRFALLNIVRGFIGGILGGLLALLSFAAPAVFGDILILGSAFIIALNMLVIAVNIKNVRYLLRSRSSPAERLY